jgi:hypothetical protein
LSWNATQTYDKLGTISADYAYTKSTVANTTAYVGIYGWSKSPLVEFYIVDEWIGWNPASNATNVGTFTVDGAKYGVYKHQQVGQPSIESSSSISEHFKQWASLGLTLGNMYEAKLLVEAMASGGTGTGTIDFTTATVTAK